MWQAKELSTKEVYDQIWEVEGLSFLQSWPWAEVKDPNWKPVHLKLISSENDTPSVVTILTRSLQFGVRLGYLPRVNLKDESFLRAIREYVSVNNVADVLVVEPCCYSNGTNDYYRKLPQYPTHIQPDYTNVVLLGKEEDELWMNLKGKYRRNIKKSRREEVEVEVLSYPADNAVESFYDVMKSIFARTDYVMHGKEYFQKVWQKMGEAGNAFIALARVGDEVVGAYLLVKDKVRAYELYGGVTLKGRDVEAGYLLKWEAIIWAKKQGLSEYDHWGVATFNQQGEYDKNHSLYAISKFKSGFGGEDIAFPKTRYLAINHLKTYLLVGGQYLQLLIIKLKKLRG